MEYYSNFAGKYIATNREIQSKVTIELVEFERWMVQVKDFRQIADHLREIYRIDLLSIEYTNKKWKISTRNRA